MADDIVDYDAHQKMGRGSRAVGLPPPHPHPNQQLKQSKRGSDPEESKQARRAGRRCERSHPESYDTSGRGAAITGGGFSTCGWESGWFFLSPIEMSDPSVHAVALDSDIRSAIMNKVCTRGQSRCTVSLCSSIFSQEIRTFVLVPRKHMIAHSTMRRHVRVRTCERAHVHVQRHCCRLPPLFVYSTISVSWWLR
jgi:hypothetical protein